MRRWIRMVVCGWCATAAWGSGAAGQPAQRVEIDKTSQTLRAYEGNNLVFQSRVSTGREGKETPSGRFRAGGKFRMHYSRLYHNAPMPYSVSVGGNYFIHGYSSVPDRPASHGCIRMPLDNGNPAQWFYQWVRSGTPIRIYGHWPGESRRGAAFANTQIMRAEAVARLR